MIYYLAQYKTQHITSTLCSNLNCCIICFADLEMAIFCNRKKIHSRTKQLNNQNFCEILPTEWTTWYCKQMRRQKCKSAYIDWSPNKCIQYCYNNGTGVFARIGYMHVCGPDATAIYRRMYSRCVFYVVIPYGYLYVNVQIFKMHLTFTYTDRYSINILLIHIYRSHEIPLTVREYMPPLNL